MCFFKQAKVKTVAAPKAPPAPNSPVIEEKVDTEGKKRRKSLARNDTILTGGQGAGAPPTAGAKTLLGQ